MIIQMIGFPIVKSELQRDVEKKWADHVSLLDATLDAERITSINTRMLVCVKTCNKIQVKLVEDIFPKSFKYCRNATLSKTVLISKLATNKSI